VSDPSDQAFEVFQPHLRVIGGSHAGQRVPLRDHLLAGRDPSCGVYLAEAGVTRRHCEFFQAEHGWVLRDMGSRNASYVNGKRVDGGTHTLQHGDLVQVGHVSQTRLQVWLSPDEPQAGHPCAGCGKTIPLDLEQCWSCSLERKVSVGDALREVIGFRLTHWSLRSSPYGPALEDILDLIKHRHPDMAIAKCRHVLEQVVSDLFRDHIGDPGTRPLEQAIRDLSKADAIPRKIRALCEVVRELGNVGSHALPDAERLSARDAYLAAQALTLVLDWRMNGEPKTKG
jgi:hypothetical protein